MFEPEILRLCRKVQQSQKNPKLRDKAIAELKAAIRAEQNTVKLSVESFVKLCRDMFSCR